MDRYKQLKERDVLKEADELNPSDFLRAYIQSNFPQTSAYPSPAQKALGMQQNTNDESRLNFKKRNNPLAGTSFDRPQAY
jgi:hypothetical protein